MKNIFGVTPFNKWNYRTHKIANDQIIAHIEAQKIIDRMAAAQIETKKLMEKYT